MKKYISILAVMAAALLTATSCIRDLDIQPVDDDVVLPADILTGVEQYEQVLAKCYIGLAVSGSAGENSGDIDGIDNGFGQYVRCRSARTESAACPIRSLPSTRTTSRASPS